MTIKKILTIWLLAFGAVMTVFQAAGAWIVHTLEAGVWAEVAVAGVISAVVITVSALIFRDMFRKSCGRIFKETVAAAEAITNGKYDVSIEESHMPELNALARAIGEAARQIDRLENTHMDFLSNISHELRTPMTVIGGYADGMLDGVIPPEKHHEYLKLISEEIKRFAKTMESLRAILKFHTREVRIKHENLNIIEMMSKTFDIFTAKIEEKGAILELGRDMGFTVSADPELISQMLYHLAENAVKFVNPGGKITFSVTGTETENVLALKNTGDGMEDTMSAFALFYKDDKARSDDPTGLGVGLYFVKTIANEHGGSVSAHSEGDETVFKVFLPK